MIFVRFVEAPSHIHGWVMPDDNGDYNIYINQELDETERQKALGHELSHVYGHDLDKLDTLSRDEIEATRAKRGNSNPKDDVVYCGYVSDNEKT